MEEFLQQEWFWSTLPASLCSPLEDSASLLLVPSVLCHLFICHLLNQKVRTCQTHSSSLLPCLRINISPRKGPEWESAQGRSSGTEWREGCVSTDLCVDMWMDILSILIPNQWSTRITQMALAAQLTKTLTPQERTFLPPSISQVVNGAVYLHLWKIFVLDIKSWPGPLFSE